MSIDERDAYVLTGKSTLWGHLGQALRDPTTLKSGKNFAYKSGNHAPPTEAILISADLGKNLVGGNFSMVVRLPNGQVRYLITDQAHLLCDCLNPMLSGDLEPGTAFANHVAAFEGGYISQRTKQSALQVISARDGHAVRTYALIHMLNDYLSEAGKEAPELVSLEDHPIFSRSDKHHFARARSPVADRINTARAALEGFQDGDGYAASWSPADFTKEKIMDNAFDPTAASSWLFCSLVLNGGTNMPKGLMVQGADDNTSCCNCDCPLARIGCVRCDTPSCNAWSCIECTDFETTEQADAETYHCGICAQKRQKRE